MPSLVYRAIILPAILSAALLLSACQHEPATNTAGDTPDRAAVDALDRATADSRKARISDVSYDVSVDMTESEEQIAGKVLIKFSLSSATSGLTIDFNGGSLGEVIVNGAPGSPTYNGHFITLPASQLRKGLNDISIAYHRPYGHDGTGLHRFVDPEDGRTYMHSYLWPYYANRVLPSFDQPNLKAKFKLRVKAPADWTVVSATLPNIGKEVAGSRIWTFAETPNISTYAFSLHAGQYKIWTDNSGDVPLRLMARQSLAKFVAVDEWFETTQKGMSFFSDYFDIPYPFQKYDQLIVPEFNIGGMENVAAVTYTERYIQRQQSSRAERESRTGTVLHELAHMWFGDLVTHDWWNGMWLNESFATQMATLAKRATTEFTDDWHGYFIDSKSRAYARDSRVTTHPIEMVVRSTDQFTELFDAITYQKGGSALKQLQYRVGAENYRRGVSAYLKEHAWGTTELADFIDHQSKASGVNLDRWSDEWLTKPGFNTLAAAPVCEGDSLVSLDIMQSAPASWPFLREHKTSLAFYTFDKNGDLTVTTELPITLSGELTSVDLPDRQPCPSLINPNYNDWTFAQIAISENDEDILADHLGAITDPLSRSMFLMALFDKAKTGETPFAAYARHALKLAETEQNFRVLEQITSSLTDSIDTMQRLLPETQNVLPELLHEVEQLGLQRARSASSHDLKQLWFDLFISVAASKTAIEMASALLDGTTKIDGIEISADVRWRLLTILSRNAVPGTPERLEAEIAHDPSDFGQRKLLSARAASPDLANKEHWVRELQSPGKITNLAKQRAVMAELFPATQTGLQLPLLKRILGSLPTMSSAADPYFLSSYTREMLTPMCRSESSTLMNASLNKYASQLNPTAMRFLREAHQADTECQLLRTRQ